MDVEPQRALILAGGGIRVAWQAGVVQALDEAGLAFAHGDGTSGGIFTLGMLMSGVPPADLGRRWRTLRIRRFVSLLPIRSYIRLPTNWSAVGAANGIRTRVLPHLGIELERIRTCSTMSGTFNVADFDEKLCIAIPNSEIDLDRLVAGVSLPIFMPAVQSAGRTWTDAVWIKDANLLEGVRRGCDELWLIWCIANTPLWGNGALEQYVHMIELSANGALFGELAQIADINARRALGEAVMGSTKPIVLHVVRPDLPLPLDPDFVAGRISAEALVAMGYRDAWRYLDSRSPRGVALDSSATKMRVAPLGCRISLRIRGSLRGAGRDRTRFVASFVIELSDLERFVALPEAGVDVVGGIDSVTWGYRPIVRGSAKIAPLADGRQIEIRATIRVDGAPTEITLSTTIPADRGSSQRWRTARRWSVRCVTAGDVSEGRASVAWSDVIRLAFMFEPSGAHTLADRLRALRMMVKFLRRRT